ncbi:DUF1045 domain-containing protein [Parasulfitobacter algicola]|uniref:DUF1045 domain-containing protein n=1 Tax=Parasulfitobacter algicola TaxID=2614809 RepID=A0ABX2IKT4_9RHOB|nr:DUF1045 domain-containing protein [Sulfitobacter algicola]NSX53476.1 DUF1045 domain-containing protein [Sulfitobacter algicola]
MNFKRFGIYYTPPKGSFADFGASWLGWDIANGTPMPHLDSLPGINTVTHVPRKYGFHGTLKPPFYLADGLTRNHLQDAIAKLSQSIRPAKADGLQLSQIAQFLALTPVGDTSGLNQLADSVVTELDKFRRPATADELARRRKSNLSARQGELLEKWGYPYVLEEFRFHITVSGSLDAGTLQTVRAALKPQLDRMLPAPFVINDLTLVGEADDGFFHEIHRYALTG